MKANQTISYTINETTGVIVFSVKGKDDITLDTGKIHANNMKTAAFKGLAQQRVVDGAAIAKANKDGTIKSEEEMLAAKYAGMKAIVAHLESGSDQWGMKQRTVSVPTVDHSLTIRALAELRKVSVELVNGMIDKQSTALSISRTAVLNAFAGRADVADLVRGYRAAAVADIDTDKMMADWIASNPE